MAFDAHANFAVSAVATAPSPATSGTSLVVTAGHGVRFPAVPFNATICPAATQPDPSNAEIVRVTAIATDTLTIVRAQGGTSARTVVATDQIFAGITAKTLTDIESALGDTPQGSFASIAERLAAQRHETLNSAAAFLLTVPGVGGITLENTVPRAASFDYYHPIWCASYLTFDQVVSEVTTASGSAGSVARVGIFAADSSWQPGTLIEEFGTIATDALGVKTIAPAAGTRTLPGGRYLLAMNCSAGTTTFRSGRGSPGTMLSAALGPSAMADTLRVPRTHAAFPSPGTAWTTIVFSAIGLQQSIFLRVTDEAA